MLWQDYVISIANLFFTYSLVHQVYYGFKKRKGMLTLTASGLTVIGLFATSIVFITLSMYISSLICFLNGTLWLILFMQSIIYKKE